MSKHSRKNRVLVTGATGFLGRHLIEHLCRTDSEVEILALVRDRSAWDRMDWTAELGERVRLLEGCVTDLASLERAPAGLTGIYHCAAVVKHSRRGAEETYATNVEGTANVAKLAAREKCRLVFVSTSGTVGCFDDPSRTADERAPYLESTVGGWPYYHSKILAEKRARELSRTHGFELVVVRPPVMLGPSDHKFRTTKHLITALRGKYPFLLGGGMHFVDVRDVVAALPRAMAHAEPKPVYHLPGTAWDLRRYFEVLHELSGLKVPAFTLPSRAAVALFGAVHFVAHHVFGSHPESVPDPVYGEMASKYWGLTSLSVREDLGFVARDPRETLRDTLDWLKANHPKLAAAARAPAATGASVERLGASPTAG